MNIVGKLVLIEKYPYDNEKFSIRKLKKHK